jgi:hypothetical protein
MGTMRISVALVQPDAGSFVVYLFDQRPALDPDGEPMNPDPLYEIGRLAVAPSVLLQLRSNLEAAIEVHESRYGRIPMPPDPEFSGALNPEYADVRN